MDYLQLRNQFAQNIRKLPSKLIWCWYGWGLGSISNQLIDAPWLTARVAGKFHLETTDLDM